MTSTGALMGAFLALVARPRKDEGEPPRDPRVPALVAEVRRLTRRNERLERSQVMLMEHIEVLRDELRCARLRSAVPRRQ